MKEFYLEADFYYGIAIPIECKRKIKIHLCDECYKSLNFIGEWVLEKEKSEK
jgi:hypothetical protein